MSCLHQCVDEAIQSKVKRIKARQAGGGGRIKQLVEPSVNSSGSSDIVKVSIKLDNRIRIVCIM